MEHITGESLLKKVIVRFRHKAGKNGQIFPQRSWMSGLMIISSQRLILASGPVHFMVPFDDLLSIEDRGGFPVPEGGKDKIISLVHSRGIDAYLTMVGLSPSVKKKMVRDIYENICGYFSGYELLEDGSRYPVSIRALDDGIGFQKVDGDGVIVGKTSLENMKAVRSKSSFLVELESVGRMITVESPSKSGRWLEMLMGHYINSETDLLEERQREVLYYISRNPSTTDSLSSNLSMVALEASTVLNEMVFLGWVTLDHFSKMFEITEKGKNALSSSG